MSFSWCGLCFFPLSCLGTVPPGLRLSPMRQGGGVPVWGRAMRKAPFLGWVLTGVGAEPGGRVQSPGRPGGAGGRGGLSASDSGAGCREMGEAAGKAVPGPPSSPQGQAAHSPSHSCPHRGGQVQLRKAVVPHGLGKVRPSWTEPHAEGPEPPSPLVRCVHAQRWSAQLREALGAGLALPCGALLPGLMRVKEGMAGWEHFLSGH